MRLQKQTIFGQESGNCFATCIACLLDLSIEDVPNFVSFGERWFSEAMNWLKQNGYSGLYVPGPVRMWPQNSYYIATGPSPRGEWLHCVLYYEGTSYFDPHPDDTFLVGDPVDYWWVFKQ